MIAMAWLKILSITLLLLIGVLCNDSKIFGSAVNVGHRNATPTIAAMLTKPASRTYNCFLKNNVNCNVFESQKSAETIIGLQGVLKNGPHVEEIARSYSTLKVQEYNETHFVSEIRWTIDDKASIVDTISVFLSNSDYVESQPIQRSVLNLVCSHRVDNHNSKREQAVDQDVGTVRFNCYIEDDFVKDLLYKSRGLGVLVSTLKMIGHSRVVHQVADISLHDSVIKIANFHGFVSNPPSRAKLCQMRANTKCGPVMYEPQSVEGFKEFPHGRRSPPDGKIASANNPNFHNLDEYGTGRWVPVKFPDISCYSRTHVYFNLTWYFTATHSSEDIRVYLSNERYTSEEPLSRRHLDLTPICSMPFYGRHPPTSLTMPCPITFEKYRKLLRFKEVLLLNVWNIRDTAFAFYQVVDLKPLTNEHITDKC